MASSAKDAETWQDSVTSSAMHHHDSEWEYEYSATETETYYVTLDISKADFVVRQPTFAENAPVLPKKKLLSSRLDAERPESDVASEAHNNDAAQTTRVDGKDARQVEKFGKVQILDLHTEHPTVSYRGRVFEGMWSQNIGTELLLAQRDEKIPLPAVRQLDDGIDLLAASSARITLTQKELQPVNARKKRAHDSLDEGDDGDLPVVPRPGPGASRERVDQGAFLAKLVALKKKKGETDQVTIIARMPDDTEDVNPSGSRGTGKGRSGGRNVRDKE